MRRVIALVLIISVGLAILGTSLLRPSTDTVAGSCRAEALQAGQRSITEQTAALSAQDFVRARTYSSTIFRDNVSAQAFAGIIANRYAFLMRDPGITFEQCDQDASDRVRILVSFRVSGVDHPLEYVLVNESQGWFIDGATDAAPRSLAV